MEAILRREKLWSLVETKQTPIAYPIPSGGVSFQNQKKLDSEKRVRGRLILSVADNLIELVARKQGPVDSWDLLCKMYNARDQQQILWNLYEGRRRHLILSDGS